MSMNLFCLILSIYQVISYLMSIIKNEKHVKSSDSDENATTNLLM